MIYPLIIFYTVVIQYALPLAITAVVTLLLLMVWWRRWPTATSTATGSKFCALAVVALAVFMVAFDIAKWDLQREKTSPDTDCVATLAEAKTLLDQPDLPDRLFRVLAMGEAVQQGRCKNALERVVLERFYSLDANEEFTSTDMDAAWKLHQRLSPAGHVCEPDFYDYAYGGIQVRRLGPAGVAQVLAFYAAAAPTSAACLNNYVELVRARCMGVWQLRCRAELPKDFLEAFAQEHDTVKLRALIDDVWHAPPTEGGPDR